MIVFVALGPPVGLASLIGAWSVGALWFPESGRLASGVVDMLRFAPALTIKVTYLVGAPAAAFSGGLIAWLLRRERKRELLWVVLVGSIAGSSYALFLRLVLEAATFTALHIMASSIVATPSCWAIVRFAEAGGRGGGGENVDPISLKRAGAMTLLQRQPRLAIFSVFLSIGPLLGIVGFTLADIVEGALPKLDWQMVVLAYVTGLLPAAAVAALASRRYRRRRDLPLLPLIAAGTALGIIDLVGFSILAPPSVGETPRDYEVAYLLGRFLAMHLTAVLGCWCILKTLELWSSSSRLAGGNVSETFSTGP
jgi:hypothetical protein